MDEVKRRRVEEEMEALLEEHLQPRPRPLPELITDHVGDVTDKSNDNDVMYDNSEDTKLEQGDNLKAEDPVKLENLKVEEEKIVQAVEKVHTHNPYCPNCRSRT